MSSKFSFGSNSPEVFVTSQWNKELKTSFKFVVFRWMLAALYISITTFSVTGFIMFKVLRYWPIFMTHWGILLCTVTTTFAAILTTRYHHNRITLTPHSPSYRILWLLSNVSTIFAFVITIVYWGFLYKAKPGQNAWGFVFDVLIHGVNSLGMIAELIVVRYPINFAHVVYPMGLFLFYITFTLIYYLAGGTNFYDGNRYIYPILKWGEDNKGALTTVFGILALMIVLQIILCVVQRLRSRLHIKIFGPQTTFDVSD